METDYSIKQQDCNVILSAFERGVAYNSDEPSLHAGMARQVQNTKFFAGTATKSLNSYNVQSTPPLAGQTNANGESLSGMKIGNQFLTVPSKKSNSILAKALKECIPCDFRMIHGIDLNPTAGFMAALKADAKMRLGVLGDLKALFTNFDTYGDFCQLAEFLHFMCIPDLQRIIMVLMSMLMDFSLGLLTLNGLLQALLAPFFTPLLMGITSLLDQLVQLVLSPLTCIITSIQENIRKIDLGFLTGDTTLTSARAKVGAAGQTASSAVRSLDGQVKSGLMQLGTLLDSGQALLRNKLTFYTHQLSALLGQWGSFDLGRVGKANQKLYCIRLIALVRAMIKAKSMGTKLCQDGQKPSATELDNFFSTYVSPNSPYNLSVNSNGDLQISPKLTAHQQNRSNTGTTAAGITTTAKPLLNAPPEVRIIKCRINTSGDDVAKVNQWIAELNQT